MVKQADGTLAVRDAGTLGGGGGGSIINVGEPPMNMFVDTALSSFGTTLTSPPNFTPTLVARASFPAPRSGTLKNLFSTPSRLPNGNAVVKITVRVNGINTALTVTHSAVVNGSNGVSNTVNSIPVTQGDVITTMFENIGADLANADAANYRTVFVFE